MGSFTVVRCVRFLTPRTDEPRDSIEGRTIAVVYVGFNLVKGGRVRLGSGSGDRDTG